MGGGGEDAHVQPQLGEEHLGGLDADAGDRIQPRDGGQDGRVWAGAGVGAGGAVGVHALRGGDGGQQLLDTGGETVDLGGQGVVLVQQQAGQLGVVVVEPAGEGLHQCGVLGLHPPTGQAGQHFGVALAGDQRLQHRPAGFAHDVGGHGGQLDQGVFQQLLVSVATVDSLIRASSSSFSSRWTCRDRSRVRSIRSRV